MLIFIGVLVFLAVTFTLVSILFGYSTQMTRLGAVLSYREVEATPGFLPQEMARSLWLRFFYPQVVHLLRTVGALMPSATIARTELRLDRAGRPWGLGARGFLGAELLLGLLVGLGLMWLLRSLPGNLTVLGALTGGVMGGLVPSYVVDRQAAARSRAVRGSLPDTIDLLVVSVEAGLSLDAAVAEMVARENHVLAQELGRSLEEMRAGRTREESWRDMARRLNLQELTAFVATICQGERMGVSIGQILHAHADAMRMRRSLYARELAAKIPIKMLFPMIFFIFPCLFVVMLGPGVVQMMDTFRSMLS